MGPEALVALEGQEVRKGRWQWDGGGEEGSGVQSWETGVGHHGEDPPPTQS